MDRALELVCGIFCGYFVGFISGLIMFYIWKRKPDNVVLKTVNKIERLEWENAEWKRSHDEHDCRKTLADKDTTPGLVKKGVLTQEKIDNLLAGEESPQTFGGVCERCGSVNGSLCKCKRGD